MPLAEPHELGAPLVHRQRGRHDAAAGVRNAERLERALHRAVLAEAAVQRDEHAREAVALEARTARARRDRTAARRRPCCAARRARRCRTSARSRARRDGPPSSTATLPKRSVDPASLKRPLPTMRTSRSSSTPVRFAHDALHVRDQRLDVGRARRAAGLTMKFACFSRDARAADREALEAARLDQPRRVVARADCGTRCRRWAGRAAGSRCAARAAP